MHCQGRLLKSIYHVLTATRLPGQGWGRDGMGTGLGWGRAALGSACPTPPLQPHSLSIPSDSQQRFLR